MDNAKKTKGSTGRRYSEAERAKILAFVQKQGRGGIAAAQKKFGVSYVALKRWTDGIPSTKGQRDYPLVSGKMSIDKQVRMAMAPTLSSLTALKKALRKFVES
jgi:transposase-like protein